MSKNIVIFSTKGGVGKTFIAANLAVSLALDQGKSVCLIDLDTQGVGDMAHMLNLKSSKSLADLLNLIKKNPAEIDFKKSGFVTQSDFGIDFIEGILRPQQAGFLDPKYLDGIFSALEKKYDYIVVDAGKSFNDVFLATLNQANLILLVVTPDVLSIYQTKWALDTLQFLQFPLNMIRAVLNRAESVSGISWQEVKVSLPIDIIAQIPSEGKILGQAVNRGVPVLLEAPKAKISQAIKKLSNVLDTQENIFIARSNIGNLKLQEPALDRSKDFWSGYNLTEAVDQVSPLEDKDEILVLKKKINARLIEELNLRRLDLNVFNDPKKSKDLRKRAEVAAVNLLSEEAGSFIPSQEVRKKIVKEIIDEALGLGPLEDLLDDQDVTDIMVNNKDEIYIEKFGKIHLTSKKFISNEQVKTIIERIIAPIGRRIDESVPMVDARLADGSRVNAIIPPLSLTGPTLTIRKFRKEKLKTEELIRLDSLNSYMADFIKACVISRKNIIVSGGTGSGKTTILNALSSFIPNNERIITIEDAAELKLHQEHWVRLESRPPNIEGRGAIAIRDLFRNTLRMRPDRIIIGECRSIETLDMLQAMNTGHDGSMTTIHANSTHDVMSRLDSMILMSGVDLPVRSIREMIASAVDIIVHTARLSDGTRKIIQITEIAGMKDEVHINLKDIFVFKQSGIDKEKGKIIGGFSATGYKPSFFEEFKVNGIFLPEEMFKSL